MKIMETGIHKIGFSYPWVPASSKPAWLILYIVWQVNRNEAESVEGSRLTQSTRPPFLASHHSPDGLYFTSWGEALKNKIVMKRSYRPLDLQLTPYHPIGCLIWKPYCCWYNMHRLFGSLSAAHVQARVGYGSNFHTSRSSKSFIT